MEVITKISEMQTMVFSIKDRKESIGFVPTMGALHEGHVSLMRSARDENDELVVSIYLNPTQFDNKEDFDNYPGQLDKDIEIVERENADVVFAPCTDEMYPEGFCTYVTQDKLTDTMCGRLRPGHFNGVTTIVTKLFNIVKPDKAYFGQKDYQQSVVVEKLVADLNMEIDVKVLPTVRDEDGLALSSRNKRLNPEERRSALCIYSSLLKAKSMFASNVKDAKEIIEEMTSIIKKAKHTRTDYISIVNAHTLEDVSLINEKAVAAVAVWIGNTRLIDNIILE
ncbi:MAG: pantoate--beta-alanine ligase [Planctomycetes bacterium RIFCSPHIGHO2_02_FULL_40_12]|nr:MAG: pantoate--beta-alanine ligase [Planctomycetes bacterium RIFCSPHIGHO2_02_FULL_40_12]OHC02356.1 MAG: pantoate--beta-alanine ligase [Planctomycetes bacterium RIFCSPLOWO2_12_FULL_40_19]